MNDIIFLYKIKMLYLEVGSDWDIHCLIPTFEKVFLLSDWMKHYKIPECDCLENIRIIKGKLPEFG